MDSIKGKIFSVIEDNRALVSVFIVIFYFEDFMICSQNTSLLRTAVSFDSIPLLPFILFFAIIAVSKIAWHIIHYSIHAFLDLLGKPSFGDQSIRDSFTAFLLCIFSGVYTWQFAFNASIRPVSRVEHPML